MDYETYLYYIYKNNIANLEVEKQNMERRIKGDKKSIAKDMALIGGSVVLTGVGIYGMYYLAPEIIDLIKNDEVLRVSTIKSAILLQGSFSTSLIGLITSLYGKAKIKLDREDYTYHKDMLNKIEDVIKEEKEIPKKMVLTK